MNNSSLKTFVINVICFFLTYYLAILLHEYGHGTTAWLYGFRQTPWDGVIYGGWFLQHVDEGVHYHHLMSLHAYTEVALIGISGAVVSTVLLLISFFALSRQRIQKCPIAFAFFFWFLIVNMVPITQYFCLSVFSQGGDMGHFVHGLQISPWWMFVPGTIITIAFLARVLMVEVPKAYQALKLQSVWAKRLLLFVTLAEIFWMLYLHEYNPIADNHGILIDQVLAVGSIFLVPVLFFVFNPKKV